MTQPTTTTTQPDANDGANVPDPTPAEKDADRVAEERALRHAHGSRHQRAGYTKSKGRGTPKAKRRMAKTSRQRNRGKR